MADARVCVARLRADPSPPALSPEYWGEGVTTLLGRQQGPYFEFQRDGLVRRRQAQRRLLEVVHEGDQQVDFLRGRVGAVALFEDVLGDQLLAVVPQRRGRDAAVDLD